MEVNIKTLMIVLMLLISSIVHSQTYVEVITEESEFSFVIKLQKQINTVEQNINALCRAIELKTYYERLNKQYDFHQEFEYSTVPYYKPKFKQGGTNEINW